MRVMVLVKATQSSESGPFDPVFRAEMMAAMGAYNDALAAAGILVMAEGLAPSHHGKRIAFDGPVRTFIDGPFGNVADLVAGFWLWDVRDMDEAMAWAMRCPNPMPGPSEIEVRPFHQDVLPSQ